MRNFPVESSGRGSAQGKRTPGSGESEAEQVNGGDHQKGEGRPGDEGHPHLGEGFERVLLPHDQHPDHAEDDDEQCQYTEHADKGDGVKDDRALRQDGKVDQKDNANEDTQLLPRKSRGRIVILPCALIERREEDGCQSDAHAAAGEQPQRVVGDIEVGNGIQLASDCLFEQVEIGVRAVDAKGDEEK